MSAHWFLVAFATVSVFGVYCETGPAGQDERSEDLFQRIASFFGYEPCIDETCKDYHIYGPSDFEVKDPASEAGKAELPRAHCMLLRQSAVNLFREMETKYPGISDRKYRMLEELVEYMHQFSSLKLQHCQPNMQLIELVILAANSLKAQYTLQGNAECIYETSEKDIKKPVPSNEVTKMPCDPESSGHLTDKSPVCPGSTMKPELGTKPTEKPYEPSSTQRISEKPYVPSSTLQPTVVTTEKPCPDDVTTEKPCPDDVTTEKPCPDDVTTEAEPIIPQVGSMRGIPGFHYPNYTDIPVTSFSCADKKCIPGFYADMDTGCQVFHVCYEHRRESFLCPVGTIFNQPILACDYWYSSNCSLASHYYDVNEKTKLKEDEIDAEVEDFLTSVKETEKDKLSVDLDKIASFFPVKVIVTDIKPEVVVPVEPRTSHPEVSSVIVDKIATTGTKVISSTRHVIKRIPEPVVRKPALKSVEPNFFPAFKKPMKMTDLLKEAVIPLVKAKLAAIPISKATVVPVAKLTKAKVAAVPVLTKAKVAAAVPAAKIAIAAPVIAKAKVAVPAAKVAVAVPVIAKGKITVPAFKVAAAKVAAKSSMPALKAKVASSVPLAKTKVVPLMKAKIAKSAGTPLLKGKMLALPLAKSKLAGPLPLAKIKLAKAAAISPLTKKALALGYMKLLKAKKVALMG